MIFVEQCLAVLHIFEEKNQKHIPNNSYLSYMEECIYKMCQSQCLYTTDIVAIYGSNSRCGGLENQRICVEDLVYIEYALFYLDAAD